MVVSILALFGCSLISVGEAKLGLVSAKNFDAGKHLKVPDRLFSGVTLGMPMIAFPASSRRLLSCGTYPRSHFLIGDAESCED